MRDYPNNRIQSLDWDTGDETDAADEILFDYRVNNDERRHDLSKNLAKSMRQIRGYQKLCHEAKNRFILKLNHIFFRLKQDVLYHLIKKFRSINIYY